MNIEHFTKGNLHILRKEIEAALAGIEGISGIKFELGTMRFDLTTCSVTLNMTSAQDAEKKAADLDMIIKHYGIAGKSGRNGETLIGYNRSARRFPFQVKKADGKIMTYTLALTRGTFGEASEGASE